ncbi:MAG: M28 family metallopeptidase [Erythrobacter sp.]
MRFALLTSAAALSFATGVAAVPASAEEAPATETVEAVSQSSKSVKADRGRLEADVRFLADDALEGREAGTAGYALAAGYVAGQYAAIGLQAAGNDATYFQAVPMVSSTSIFDDQASLIVTDRAGAAVLPAGTSGDDYFTFPKSDQELGEVEGELVFVGYGFASEGYDQDDFAGLDLTGKIAVRLRGAPGSLNSEERAHFGATVGQRLSERGAIGTISLTTPTDNARFPFEQVKEAVSATSMSWADEDGKAFTKAPNIEGSAILSPALSEALFKGQQVSWDDVTKYAAGELDSLPSFDMGLSARTVGQATVGSIISRNVIGMVPGTDPEVADEYVVVTGHLDHTGKVETPEEGDDEINNGAMDNATGIASMLEAARLLRDNPGRRPVVFLALTAEEKGLVGSDYFARNPTLGDGEIVANINLDMPILTFEFTDVTAFGAERSTLLPAVEAAAASNGITLSPDPIPEQGLFTRSDQYRFVEQGIPAIYLVTGWANGGQAAQMGFLGKHYHRVSDEISLVDFEQLGRFTDVNLAIIQNVANMAEKPVWKAGDFFAKTFGGEMEE